MVQKLLIVEDEFLIANDIRSIVTKLGFAVMGVAKSADDALGLIKSEKPDLALLDINIIGNKNGIELAKILVEKYNIPHLYITSYSDKDTVVKMNKTRPLGYILKPFDERDIRVALQMISTSLEKPDEEQKVIETRNIIPKLSSNLIGASSEIQETLKKAKLVAPTDVTVLIFGETGVGKEVIMQNIVDNSQLASKQLVKVNCAALPTELIESALFGHEKGSFTGATEKRIGKLEQANNGTLFLDEIGELPLSSQSKLLRFLQEKEIESVGGSIQKKIQVRVIAATNKNLAKCVQDGTFRADLYFRLSTFPIEVAPLRLRKADIIPLANYFLERAKTQFNKLHLSLDKESEKKLLNYNWPGNVRELEHIINRSTLLSSSNIVNIALEKDNSLYQTNQKEFHLKSLEEVEREQIIATLKYCNGKIRGNEGAAEILKLHPNTLDFRIKKLGINKNTIFE